MNIYITEIKCDGAVIERGVSSFFSRKLDGGTHTADCFMNKEQFDLGGWTKAEAETIPAESGRLVSRHRYSEKETDGRSVTWWEIDVIELNVVLNWT